MKLVSTFLVRPEEESAFLPLLPEDYETLKSDHTLLLGAATKEGVACGVIWGEIYRAQLRIIHIQTARAYQNRGIATQLLDDLYRSNSRMRRPLVITATFLKNEDTEGIFRLLDGRREVGMSLERCSFRITPQCRENSEHFQKLCSRAVKAENFYDLAPKEQQLLLCRMLLEDRQFLKDIPPQELRRDLCFTCGSPARSAVFMTETAEKELELSFIYVDPGKMAAQDLQRLITACCTAIHRNYQDHTLNIYTENMHLKRLIRRIFPNDVTFEDKVRADWAFYKDFGRGELT